MLMVVAPLLSNPSTLCLYRINGQEIIFKIQKGVIVTPHQKLNAEEQHYIYNTYIKQ